MKRIPRKNNRYHICLIALLICLLPACKKDNSANTTNNNCAITITGMGVSSVTNHYAQLMWNQSSYAQFYNVRYRVVGSSNWTTVSQVAPASGQTTTVSTDITNLAPGSNYEWQVQGMCSAASAAPFSASSNFTTAQYAFTATFKGATHTYVPDTLDGTGGVVLFSSGYQYLSGTDNGSGTRVTLNSLLTYGDTSFSANIGVLVNGITYTSTSNPPSGKATGNAPAAYYGCSFLTFSATVYNPSNASDSFAVSGSFVGDFLVY